MTTSYRYTQRRLKRSGPKSDGTWYLYGSNDGVMWVLVREIGPA